MRRQSLPRGQRSARGPYGAVDILGRALCDRRQLFASRRVGGLKRGSPCRSLPVAAEEMSQAALVNVEPGQRLTRIFRRGTILHGHEVFDDAHQFLPASFLAPPRSSRPGNRMAMIRRIPAGRMVFELAFDIREHAARAKAEKVRDRKSTRLN